MSVDAARLGLPAPLEAFRADALRVLAAIRQQRFRYALMARLLQCALVGAGAAILAAIAALLLPLASTAAGERLAVGAAGLVVAALALIVGIPALARRRPSLGDVAVDIDRRHALDDRVGALLALGRLRVNDGNDAVVARGFLADAAVTAGPVLKAELARTPDHPFRPPLLLLAAIAAAIALSLLIRPEATPIIADATRAAPAALAEPEVAALRAEIAMVAAAIAADAETRDDPFLAAIARELDTIGATMAEAAITDRAELQARLGELRAFAEQGYGNAPAGTADTPPAALDRFDRLVDDLATAAALPDRIEAGAGGDDITPRAPGETPIAEGAETPGATAGVDDLALPPAPGETGAGMGAGVEDIDPALLEAARWGEVDPMLEQEMLDFLDALPPFLQPAGAAANAGRGAGDLAGGGTQPLTGESEGAAPEFAEAEPMMLPGEAGEDGARIRIEAVPDTMRTEPGGMPAIAGATARLDEPAIRRHAVSPGDAGIVGRYFAQPEQAAP